MVKRLRNILSIFVPNFCLILTIITIFICGDFLSLDGKNTWLNCIEVIKETNANFALIFGYILIFIGCELTAKNKRKLLAISSITFILAGFMFLLIKFIVIVSTNDFSYEGIFARQSKISIGSAPLYCALGCFFLSMITSLTAAFVQEK